MNVTDPAATKAALDAADQDYKEHTARQVEQAAAKRKQKEEIDRLVAEHNGRLTELLKAMKRTYRDPNSTLKPTLIPRPLLTKTARNFNRGDGNEHRTRNAFPRHERVSRLRIPARIR